MASGTSLDPLREGALLGYTKRKQAQIISTAFGPHRAFHIGVQGQELQYSLQELWDVEA